MSASRVILLSSALAGTLTGTVVTLQTVKYAFGYCDAKFGCTGGIQFAFLIGAIAGLVSAVAWAIVLLALDRVRFGVGGHSMLVVCVAGIVLAIALPVYNANAPFESIAGLIMGWATLSTLLTSALLVCSKALPNKSLERSRDR